MKSLFYVKKLITVSCKQFGEFNPYNNYNIKKLSKKFNLLENKDLSRDYFLTHYHINRENKIKLEKQENIVETLSKDKVKFKNYIKIDRKRVHKLQKVISNKHFDSGQLDYKKHVPDMFNLDYTAQTLENFRRLKENKIFNRKNKIAIETKKGIEQSKKSLIYNFTPQNYLDAKIESFKITKETNIRGLSNFKKTSLLEYYDYENTSNIVENSRIEGIFSNLKINSSSTKNSNENDEFYKKVFELNNQQSNPKINLLEQTNVVDLDPQEKIPTLLNPNISFNKFNANAMLVEKCHSFENRALEKYQQKDIFSLKGRLSFAELSASQMLNYLKYNINNSRELFGIL